MENKNTAREKNITLVITTILTFITFGLGFWGGRQYAYLKNRIYLQDQRLSLDSLRIQVDSVNYNVQIWKLKTSEKYKNCQ